MIGALGGLLPSQLPWWLGGPSQPPPVGRGDTMERSSSSPIPRSVTPNPVVIEERIAAVGTRANGLTSPLPSEWAEIASEVVAAQNAFNAMSIQDQNARGHLRFALSGMRSTLEETMPAGIDGGWLATLGQNDNPLPGDAFTDAQLSWLETYHYTEPYRLIPTHQAVARAIAAFKKLPPDSDGVEAHLEVLNAFAGDLDARIPIATWSQYLFETPVLIHPVNSLREVAAIFDASTKATPSRHYLQARLSVALCRRLFGGLDMPRAVVEDLASVEDWLRGNPPSSEWENLLPAAEEGLDDAPTSVDACQSILDDDGADRATLVAAGHHLKGTGKNDLGWEVVIRLQQGEWGQQVAKGQECWVAPVHYGELSLALELAAAFDDLEEEIRLAKEAGKVEGEKRQSVLKEREATLRKCHGRLQGYIQRLAAYSSDSILKVYRTLLVEQGDLIASLLVKVSEKIAVPGWSLFRASAPTNQTVAAEWAELEPCQLTEEGLEEKLRALLTTIADLSEPDETIEETESGAKEKLTAVQMARLSTQWAELQTKVEGVHRELDSMEEEKAGEFIPRCEEGVRLMDALIEELPSIDATRELQRVVAAAKARLSGQLDGLRKLTATSWWSSKKRIDLDTAWGTFEQPGEVLQQALKSWALFVTHYRTYTPADVNSVIGSMKAVLQAIEPLSAIPPVGARLKRFHGEIREVHAALKSVLGMVEKRLAKPNWFEEDKTGPVQRCLPVIIGTIPEVEICQLVNVIGDLDLYQGEGGHDAQVGLKRRLDGLTPRSLQEIATKGYNPLLAGIRTEIATNYGHDL